MYYYGTEQILQSQIAVAGLHTGMYIQNQNKTAVAVAAL